MTTAAVLQLVTTLCTLLGVLTVAWRGGEMSRVVKDTASDQRRILARLDDHSADAHERDIQGARMLAAIERLEELVSDQRAKLDKHLERHEAGEL